MSERLRTLADAGVSIWLDDLDRDRLRSGGLADLVANSFVTGVTTNPSIFNNALAGEAGAYEEQLRDLAIRRVSRGEAVRALTGADVRSACDVLRPVWEATNGIDGRVSIEVDPRLARKTAETVAEARALWWAVDRPNTLIKIPGTVEGLPAVSAALGEGISVNVTLIFSPKRYVDVMDAWLTGLESAQAAGSDLSTIESVASFFVSRVDTAVDARLKALGTDAATDLLGKAAIANARLAYAEFSKVMASQRWLALAAAGARPQRPLWASTGVKDPAYDDTRYVVDLVTAGTVNTMPEKTMRAVADHGVVQGDTIQPYLDDAAEVFEALAGVGIDMDEVFTELEDEGVDKFIVAWNDLLDSLESVLESRSST
ncbi:MAG: transaldolase [Candidatus Nanopelagicales bacterium]|nr:transaldolase [Candidatus Nanopelagicales bacterium]